MSVKITRIKGSNQVRVSTPHGVKAKSTTMTKAVSQERLLNAIDHGWKPTGKKAKKRRTK